MNTIRWSFRLFLTLIIILGLSIGIATPTLGIYISSVILLTGTTVAIFKWVGPLSRNTMNSTELAERYDIDVENVDTVVIAIDEDEWCAVASPELRPANFAETSPFHFVTHGDTPPDEKVGRLLAEQFDQRIDKVYEMITDSDDPLQDIVDREAEELL